MYFDARAAKALQPGDYIVVQGCSGLRLDASNASKSWIYRYKSPVDGRWRQIKFGQWPALAFATAVARWEGLRQVRDSGRDASLERKAERLGKPAAAVEAKEGAYTVGCLVDDYPSDYIERNREAKNAKALHSRLTPAGGDALVCASPAQDRAHDARRGRMS